MVCFSAVVCMSLLKRLYLCVSFVGLICGLAWSVSFGCLIGVFVWWAWSVGLVRWFCLCLMLVGILVAYFRG